MENNRIARQIYTAAVERVKPNLLIQKNVKFTDGILTIASEPVTLHEDTRIIVTGAGKASALMGQELEKILGSRIHAGHIIVKYDHSVPLTFISCSEAGHPVPDKNGILGTQKIIEMVSGLKENDVHICLISGGGSALLCNLQKGITLPEIIATTELLLKCGADISEINAVRKHLSTVKGGRLASLAAPAKTYSLILSDVVNDPVDVIASGPTAPDNSSFQDAWNVFEKYELLNKLPSSINDFLLDGCNQNKQETPKPNDPLFKFVRNYIIGNNRIALEAAAIQAKSFGCKTSVVTSSMQGDCEIVAQKIIDKIFNIPPHEPTCLLFGGETTVNVKGAGLGGRNQHLALLLAKELYKKKINKNVTILCAGTDGSDGPTDATGAIVNQLTWSEAINKRVDIKSFLENNDSYNFFKDTDYHIITGPTKTNVMDIVVVLCD